MKLDKNSCSVIILAGGNSARMGYPKPWIKLYGATFLETIVTAFKNSGINDIIVVLNQKIITKEWGEELNLTKKNATIIENNFLGKERLHSLYMYMLLQLNLKN